MMHRCTLSPSHTDILWVFLQSKHVDLNHTYAQREKVRRNIFYRQAVQNSDLTVSWSGGRGDDDDAPTCSIRI